MDFKINFSKKDIELGKGRLVEELLELRVKELGQAQKSVSNQDKCSRLVGTEIKNVQKEIVYKNEHGLGVLEIQETQTEGEPLRWYKDVEQQTEEVKVF